MKNKIKAGIKLAISVLKELGLEPKFQRHGQVLMVTGRLLGVGTCYQVAVRDSVFYTSVLFESQFTVDTNSTPIAISSNGAKAIGALEEVVKTYIKQCHLATLQLVVDDLERGLKYNQQCLQESWDNCDEESTSFYHYEVSSVERHLNTSKKSLSDFLATL